MPQATKHDTLSSRRTALRFSATAIAASILAPDAKASTSVDAEIIQLCSKLARVGSAQAALCSAKGLTIAQEDGQVPEWLRLVEEESDIVAALVDAGQPQTSAGIRSMALAAMAIADIDDDGRFMFEEENDRIMAGLVLRALPILLVE